MSTPNIIQRGESFPFVFDRGGEPIDGWLCTIFVKRYPGNTASISRAITPTNGVWSGFLTAAETTPLPISQQIITAKLTNASTNKAEEQSIKFYVSSPWALCFSPTSVVGNAVVGCAVVGL